MSSKSVSPIVDLRFLLLILLFTFKNVAALYNIVDQIYIGWSEAGAYGNAATNIVYPVTVFTLGFALLIGDRASANFSLYLGEGNKVKANNSIGIGLGGQPIIGYNMGAGNVDRVKECISAISRLVILVGFVAFLIFEFAPDLIITIFGSNNTPEYVEFARLCIRIFLGGIILTCYIKAASIILQSMGSSVKSTIVALTRDVIVFIPVSAALALDSHNIVTILWAAIVSDVIGSVVAFLMVRSEIRKFEKMMKDPN